MPSLPPHVPPATDDPLRVLVIDDDRNLAEAIAESLERKGHACTVVHTGKAGTAQIEREEFDVVLTDLRMADLGGLDVVRKVREHLPDAEVYVITGYGEVKTAVEAMRLGAAHYLLKPIDMVELRAIVDKSAEKVRLARANRELRQQLDEKFGYEGVIGNGPKMQQVLRMLKAYAPTAAPVLIFGENGTGKELAAKALHTNGPRKNKAFVTMNCAALNENLLDDDMFGHEDGSYTGAKGARKGRFEHATGGTLFLDEVGDMPLSLQAKLLRVLENGEVVRIGANDPIRVDVRIIAATNRNLEAMVEDGKFRRDLYHRLKVGVVRLPALRDRKDDLPVLTSHFLKDLAHKYGKKPPGLAESVRKAFAAYEWPGNVRELRNVLESMIVLDGDAVLGPDDLPEDAGPAQAGLSATPGGSTASGSDYLVGRPLAEVERYYMERALDLADGNRETAAEMLQIGERTLYRKLQEWKKEDEQKKTAGA
ncbi:sigma-54-dependent transcriptional regulator [Fimbriiglobus ruber]|uniref:Response regulator of zinc sigma-54-dependent two-component system n=1 Tax=Fimbriiglobus ruber TaxID=1908690 RepID=A0A225E1C5_9BACT|nr:sigma-54 dependent transcriptional regulator [Fimbriiglobus ruber]OWK43289.1 Response regulator of zinc sigma-54-dependent two-component system [Fimbriiglobus ruber]